MITIKRVPTTQEFKDEFDKRAFGIFKGYQGPLLGKLMYEFKNSQEHKDLLAQDMLNDDHIMTGFLDWVEKYNKF